MKRVLLPLLLIASMPIAALAQSGVRGVVVSPDGQPLAGVRVSVGLHAAVTDSTGAFLVEGLGAGRYVIGTHPPGYQVWAAEVDVSGEGPLLSQTIVAAPPREFTRICDDMVAPALRVEVVDSSTGIVIRAPAAVTATQGDSLVRLALGLDQVGDRRVIGYFGLGGRGGTYKVKVLVEGYRPWRREGVEVPTTGCGKTEKIELRALMQPLP